MPESAEAMVVGASAVGGVCAKELAQKGVDTLLLEENHKPGKFHKCSGIMSKGGLESLGVSLGECTLNNVRGARFFAGGSEVKIESSQTKALVIDRQAFDERCAFEAQEEGAKLVLNARAEQFSRGEKDVRVVAGGSAYSCRVLVGCDGANSAVARENGFPKMRPADFVLAWEGEFSGASVPEPHLVHVYFDPVLFKGFFGWLIPVGGGRVRIGFATSDFSRARKTKEEFFRTPQIASALRSFPSPSECACAREFNYVIPVRVRERTQMGSVLLCGDSAGQVKSTTGGGVVFGGKCAQIAAEQTARFLHEGASIEYEREWRKKYGRVLSAHRFLRKLYDSVEGIGQGALLSAGVSLASVFGIDRLVAAKGDMDFIVS